MVTEILDPPVPVDFARPVLGYTAIEIVAYADTLAEASKSLSRSIGGSCTGTCTDGLWVSASSKHIHVNLHHGDSHGWEHVGTVSWRQAAEQLSRGLTPGLCAHITAIKAAWLSLHDGPIVNAATDPDAYWTWWQTTYRRLADARRSVVDAVWDAEPITVGQLTLAVAEW